MSGELSLRHGPTSGAARPAAGAGAESRLRGRRLALARAGWVAYALLTVGLFVASLPAYFSYLHVVNATFPAGPQLSPGDVRALRAHGLSLDAYAWFSIGRDFLTLLAYLAVALVIFRRKSDDRVALLAAVSLVVLPLMQSTPILGPLVWPWLADGVAFLGVVCLGLFFATFPDGRFVPGWARWLMTGWIGFWAVAIFFPDIPPRSGFFAVLLLGLVGGQIAAQVYRYRRVSTPEQRQQTKWVVAGFALSFGAYFFDFALLHALLPGLFHRPLSPLGHELGLIPADFLLLLFPLAIGMAILRHRLWDIDLLINRALVYGALTASVGGLYVLVVVGLGALIRARGNLLLSLLATGLVAILFQPLRERVQRGVNRLLYGERDDPYRVLAHLGQRLEAALTADTALPTVAETVAQALKLPFAALAGAPSDAGRAAPLLASYGRPCAPAACERVPLLYQHEEVGALLLAPRQRGEALTPADRRLLRDLAPQIAAAVHAARLAAELQALAVDLQHARERLVTAREEERRRLRRDLHDGLGPQLSSQTLTLAAARTLLHQDPDAADRLLAAAAAHAQDAVADIRRLVYALRPPALDDLGLVAAIEEQFAQYRASGVAFTLEAPAQLPPLPAAAEVACYRIAQEALTNVVRHSHARTATVRLAVNGCLVLEVCDDGQGVPPGSRGGVGLTSMRERAEELGGTCTVAARPGGGTCLCARLPLA
ncbi:MAG TPA: sensor histidine kinase [Thermomicrobiales bacterium]|nr:sensor histidine kinase [Thermomicrobiales bacterium]